MDKEMVIERAQKEANYGCKSGVEGVLYHAGRKGIYLPDTAVDGLLKEAEKNYKPLFE